MNETTLPKLKVIVERAVRPVRASLARKKKMREELLAHVSGVFEEELYRIGNDQDALTQVKSRFGEPSDLARKLQESVPATGRFGYFVEQLIEPRVDESLVRRAGRYGMMILLLDAILSTTLCLLIFPLMGKTNQIAISTYVLLLMAVGMGAVTFLVTLLATWLGRALYRTSGPSYHRAVIVAVVSCFVPILPQVIIVAGMIPFTSGDLSLGSPSVRGVLPATLLFPLILLAITKLVFDEQRYREEWASLQID